MERSLQAQKKETMRMLRDDLKIKLTDEDKARIDAATTNRQIERIGISIIQSANWQ